jgi:hypothetical protein
MVSTPVTNYREMLLRVFAATEEELTFKQVMSLLGVEALVNDQGAFMDAIIQLAKEGVLTKRASQGMHKMHFYYRMDVLHKMSRL